jgi:cysteine sulfinate desulfinase/cysteine desulfurase-like protein
MKIDAALAGSSLRISLGKYNTTADIDRLIAALQALTEQRRMFGASVTR